MVRLLLQYKTLQRERGVELPLEQSNNLGEVELRGVRYQITLPNANLMQ